MKDIKLEPEDKLALRRINYFINKRAKDLSTGQTAEWILRGWRKEEEEKGMDGPTVQKIYDIFKEHDKFTEDLDVLMKKGKWKEVRRYLKFNSFKK